MAMNNAYATYKQNSVTQSSPAELTLMLYNGALKFLKLAKKGIQENNISLKLRISKKRKTLFKS